jgi:hypothetical protein
MIYKYEIFEEFYHLGCKLSLLVKTKHLRRYNPS